MTEGGIKPGVKRMGGKKKKKSIEHRREEEREEARRCGGTFWESSTKNINACF